MEEVEAQPSNHVDLRFRSTKFLLFMKLLSLAFCRNSKNWFCLLADCFRSKRALWPIRLALMLRSSSLFRLLLGFKFLLFGIEFHKLIPLEFWIIKLGAILFSTKFTLALLMGIAQPNRNLQDISLQPFSESVSSSGLSCAHVDLQFSKLIKP